jgi:hypothetical protein
MLRLKMPRLRSLMTTISPLEPEEAWQSMEAAPLDGTPVRVRKYDEVAIASWSTELGAWVFGLAGEPNAVDRILPCRRSQILRCKIVDRSSK